MAARWPPCLRIIAATALLVHDADKLTYGQRLLVYTPHAIERVLQQPLGKWISNAHLTNTRPCYLTDSFSNTLHSKPSYSFAQPGGG